MLRPLLALSALLGLMASPAAALTLTVERSTGEAWLENTSNGVAIFDGYDIVSASALLDQDGWMSFQEWISADSTSAWAALGTLSWGEFVVRPSELVEVNLSGQTTANPGFKVYLGRPITSVVEGDLSFFYSDFTKPPAQRNTVGELRIIDLPVPSAGLMAVLGLPAVIVAALRRSRVSS